MNQSALRDRIRERNYATHFRNYAQALCKSANNDKNDSLPPAVMETRLQGSGIVLPAAQATTKLANDVFETELPFVLSKARIHSVLDVMAAIFRQQL